MSLKMPRIDKALTEELQKLGDEVIDVQPDGTSLTRRQKLAAMLWQQALGWVETGRDDYGNKWEKAHAPDLRVQTFLYERMEGKATTAAPVEAKAVKAADTVRDLARQRLNAMAMAAAGPPKVAKKDGV